MSISSNTSLLPANQGYTRYQQILIAGLAWGEKRTKLAEDYVNQRGADCLIKLNARDQYKHLNQYVQSFLTTIPSPPPHRGFLSQLALIFGVDDSSFLVKAVEKSLKRSFIPTDVIGIIILYYDSKEPTIEDVIDDKGKLICKPDFASDEIKLRVTLLMKNFQDGLYNDCEKASSKK